MPITRDALEQAIKAAFPEATIAIEDLAGDNDHWAVSITSPQFNGLTRIAQHRKVQEAVSAHDIHALSIKTFGA